MIYKTISEQIRDLVNSDIFKIGDSLPSEKILAIQFNISRMTLRKAVEQLIVEGLLIRKQGSGTFVKRKEFSPKNRSLNSFTEQMSRLDQQDNNHVIQFQIMSPPPTIAQQLQIGRNEMVYYCQRVRYTDTQPRMIEDSYLPVRLFHNLSVQHLQGSKLSYIEQDQKMAIAGCHESFSATLATAQHARLLNIQEGLPLLRIISLTKNIEGEYIDLSIMILEANKYLVSFYMQRDQSELLSLTP